MRPSKSPATYQSVGQEKNFLSINRDSASPLNSKKGKHQSVTQKPQVASNSSSLKHKVAGDKSTEGRDIANSLKRDDINSLRNALA
eukprot:CAMPEP_0170544002 /NCGR_PEP_ID=MMETSP0211-20121228/2925_1 /TAXON_ID=311385 /ORGANISM="Pseudokeronopsis sp., Strain OXSARD2" /LENGTH=85 /DNA_ID=CAMNT_0010847537 /DNA_START=820 /DNA_END=1077 /DNA_ORIENTATION=-